MLEAESVGAVAELSARSFADFPEATRAVLAMLEQQLRGSAVFVGYFDEASDRFWILDSVGDESFGLEAGLRVPFQDSFCTHMVAGRSHQLSNNVAEDPTYAAITARAGSDIGSYVGVPLEVSDGHLVGSLCAISHNQDAYSESDRQLLLVISRLLAYELERKQAARDLRVLTDQLHEQATTDSLTGLSNRRIFVESLEREWELTNRDGIPSYVVLADLDHFKQLNDTHGHAAGDQALRMFAEALRSTARETDILGRLGGDEFGVVLVRALDPETPGWFTNRLRRSLAATTTSIAVSLGIAPLAESPSAAASLELADQRMYKDKRARHDAVSSRE